MEDPCMAYVLAQASTGFEPLERLRLGLRSKESLLFAVGSASTWALFSQNHGSYSTAQNAIADISADISLRTAFFVSVDANLSNELDLSGLHF